MSESWREWTICRSAELPERGQRAFEVGEADWPFRGFLLRLDGTVHAYANICPHRSHPLDQPAGHFLAAEGRLIQCASHGALFAAETGLCIGGPCAGRSLLRLDCREYAGQLLVRAPATLQAALKRMSETA